MKRLVIMMLVFAGITAKAQTVVISDDSNNVSGSSSAVLDLKSTSKGFLTPRMTQTERDAISPELGLVIYQTDNTPGFYYYDGSVWLSVASGIGSQWVTIGNDIYYTTGNVGIGNSSPNEALDVTGNIKFSGTLMPNGTAGTSTYLLTSGGPSNPPTWQDPSTYLATYAWKLNGNSVATTKNFGTTSNFDLPFITNNSEQMRLTTAGRLGIGTTNPSTLLHVRGNNPLTLIGVQTGASTDSVLTITNGTVKKLPMGAGTAGLWSVTGNASTTPAASFIGTTDNVTFRIRTNNTERMVVDSTGQVGIGTTAPTAALYVRSSSNPLKLFGVQTGAATDSVLTIASGVVQKLPMNNGTSGLWGLRGNTGTTPATNFIGTTDQVTFRMRTNNVERMVIDSTGQVGIGITNPSALLYVRGSNPLTLMGVQTGAATDSVLTIASGVVQKLPMNNGTSGLWGLRGNAATTAATNFIGTTDNVTFRIRTNNTERMVVDSTGQVGIGITNPSALLYVRGSNPLTLMGVQTGAATDSVLTIASGVVQKLPMNNGTSGLWGLRGNAGTTPAANFIGTTDNVTFRVRTNNTERMVVDSTGQVGIGLTAPTALLHIRGNNPLTLIGVQDGASTDSVLTITNGVVKKLPMGAGTAGLWSVTGNASTTPAASFIGTTDNVTFRIRTNNIERMVVDSTGQVGIGLTAPTALLHIRGNNPLTLIGVQGGSSTDSVLTITNGVVKKLPMGAGTAGLWSVTGNTSTTAANFLGTVSNVSLRVRTNNTERMIVDSTGNVGVGTSAPAAKLDVAGTVKLGSSGTAFSSIVKDTVQITSTTNVSNTTPVTVTVTTFSGAQVGATVIVNPRAALPTVMVIMYAYVSATNQIKIVFGSTSGTISGGVGTAKIFDITVINP